MHHARIGELIERDGVAVAAAGGLRNGFGRGLGERGGEMPSRHQVAGAAGTCGMGVAPDLVVPICYRAAAVEAGARTGHHGSPEWLPSVLLVAHPLHPHRTSG